MRRASSSHLCWMLLAALLLIASPWDALAQTNGSITQSINPSGGTEAAAMLETVGYRAQAIVLEQMEAVFNGYALLAWLFSAVAILTMYGLYRMSDGVMWLLIAPPLFFFVIYQRSVNDGVEWRMGEYTQDYEMLANLPGGNLNSEVSWVFDAYNSLVSQISRTMITVLMDENAETVLKKFMSRQRILTDLLSIQIASGGLRTFLSDSLVACYQEMDSARVLAAGVRDPQFQATAEYNNALRMYQNGYTSRTKQLSSNTSRTYLGDMLRTLQSSGGQMNSILDAPVPYQVCRTQTLSRIAATPGGVDEFVSAPVSCEELWCWMELGLQMEVSRQAEQMQLESGLDAALYRSILTDIARKLATPQVLADASGNPYQGGSVLQPDLSIIPVIIGGYLLRDVIKSGQHTQMMTQFSQHTDIHREPFNFTSDWDNMSEGEQMEIARRNTAAQMAEQNKFELFTFAMIIPYIQGVILYALALMFPFFAVLLLVPRKVGAFVLWFRLWAWVKSWDIGWAVVMLIDNMLWQMLPNTVGQDLLRDPNHSPITVFDAAFDGDPTYSLTHYYVILGLLITSVPVVTAQVFLGASASLLKVLTNGAENFSKSLSRNSWMPTAIGQNSQLSWMRDRSLYYHTLKNLNTPATLQGQNVTAQLDRVSAMFEQKAREYDHAQMGLPAKYFNPSAGPQVELNAKQTAQAFRMLKNQVDRERIYINASAHMYNASRIAAVQTPMALGAGATNRVEWWNVVGAPMHNPVHADQVIFGSAQQMEIREQRQRKIEIIAPMTR